MHKFGGTSLGNSERIAAATQILLRAARTERIVAVVSATAGTTNALLEAAESARSGHASRWRATLDAIRDRHLRLARAVAANELQKSARSGGVAPYRSSIIAGRSEPRSPEAGPRGANTRGANARGAKSNGALAIVAEHERLLAELEAVLSGISLLRELSDRSRDAVAAFGELLCAPIIAAALQSAGLSAAAVDARRLVRTDDRHGRASADLAETRRSARGVLLPLLSRGVVPVVTGFIARGPDGATTTLGRSGSDTTSALLGAALGARRIVIWTDVDGVLSADPRLVPRPRLLPRLTYREAAELTYFGAKVLHFPAMIPAIAQEIPIVVRNSFKPSLPGTTIDALGSTGKRVAGRDRASAHAGGIAAISAIRGLATVSLDGKGMVGVPGIAARAFSAVARARVSVLMFSQASSEQNICMVVAEEDRARSLRALREEFAPEIALGRLDGVSAHGPVAAIAAVGEGMRGRRGIAARVFSAVARAGVNVEAIAQGSSEVNISFIVEDGDAPRAVAAVHRLCVERVPRGGP